MQLERPQVVDLVAVGEFEAVFDREQQALDDLQRRAHEAQQCAAGFERQLAEEGIHPETARWMMLRFNEFVRDLRAEVDEEVSAILDHARRLAAEPRVHPSPRLSFHGAFAARTSRTACDFIRWAPAEKLVVGPPRFTFEPPVAPAMEVVPVTAQAELATAEPVLLSAPIDADHPSAAPVRDDDIDLVSVEAAGADGDRPFWSDGDEPRSWWRRRAHVTATAALTIAAVLLVLLAVVVQVA